MDPPPTRYVDRDGAALAFQVIGSGASDVVFCWDVASHLDLMWTDPDLHHIFERLARYSRTVLVTRRGFGLSDRIDYVPSTEQVADDILAVMDAVGMRQATLVGLLSACGALALAAAKAPERAKNLVLIDPLGFGEDVLDPPPGWPTEELAALVAEYRRVIEQWGSGAAIDMLDRNLATPFNRRLMALIERSSASPATAMAYFEWAIQQDLRDVYRSVQAPVTVLHISRSSFPEAASRYVCELVPDGTFHTLAPTPPGSSIGQSFVPMIDHLEEVVTGSAHSVQSDRYLGTVLFTDVVSSTELLASIGDAKFRDLRSTHERLVRLAVEEAGGRLMTVTGDGTLSVFDGPSAAVRCAEQICRDAVGLGVQVRCGVHAGELERDGMNVAGMTVHIGARVQAAAQPAEVLVSRTVHDLVTGSGLTFTSRGERELKGVPGRWELFAVEQAGEQAGSVPMDASLQTRTDKLTIRAARRMPQLMRTAARVANAVERRRAR